MQHRRISRASLAAGALALAVLPVTAQAPLDVRVALVIGNAAYAGAGALANPVNDARAMAAALRRLGFGVTELRDASREQMAEGVAAARDALRGKNGIALFYFAGHGVQLDWRNYMVPVDARIRQADDVPRQAMDADSVVAAFRSAGTRMNILVLDACRDNPFGTASTGRGLAQMDAPPGTFLAYATAPGNVAEDGTGENGLYTGFLVQELQRPPARIEDVFKRVRLQVRQKSHGRQVPWESTSLEEDFHFTAAATRPEDLERMAADARRREQELLQQAGAAREREKQLALELERERQRVEREALAQQAAHQASAPTRPDAAAQRAADAREFERQKAEWQRIKDSTDPLDFYTFMMKYPSGFIYEQAQFRLDQLERVLVEAQPGKDGRLQLPSGRVRFQVGDVFVYDRADYYGVPLPPASYQVTGVAADRVVVNGGREVWDPMGNLVENSDGVRVPSRLTYPSDLAVGKRWRSAYTFTGRGGGRPSEIYYDYRVVGVEEVEVPAGKFRAYRIEGKGRTTAGNALSHTAWIEPGQFLLVREHWNTRPLGQLYTQYTGYKAALASFHRAPR